MNKMRSYHHFNQSFDDDPISINLLKSIGMQDNTIHYAYNKNNTLVGKWCIVNGKINGSVQIMFNNNILRCVFEVYNDTLNGEYNEYDDNGNIICKMMYYNNIMYSYIGYNPNEKEEYTNFDKTRQVMNGIECDVYIKYDNYDNIIIYECQDFEYMKIHHTHNFNIKNKNMLKLFANIEQECMYEFYIYIQTQIIENLPFIIDDQDCIYSFVSDENEHYFTYTLKNEQLNGIFIYNMFDIKIQCEFVDNKLNGNYYEYDCDGELEYMIQFKDNQYNGKYITYLSKKLVYEEKHYKDNVLHGAYSLYYNNGRIKKIAYYYNGILHGAYFEFSEDGETLVECEYRNGKLNGQYHAIINDKNISCNFIDGKLHGKHKEYNSLTNEEIVNNYVDGELIEKKVVANATEIFDAEIIENAVDAEIIENVVKAEVIENVVDAEIIKNVVKAEVIENENDYYVINMETEENTKTTIDMYNELDEQKKEIINKMIELFYQHSGSK